MSINNPPTNIPITNEDKGLQGLQARQEKLEGIVYVVVVVLFVGFMTMFVGVADLVWNSWTSKQASYDDLMVQVAQQSGKIDMLTNEVNQENVGSKQQGDILIPTSTP